MDGVSFTADSEILTLLGPSGCGKSTTLRCIAGLETPDAGTIAIGGEIVECARTRVSYPPERRGVGMVFQSYALWPHMTVFENVAYGLRRKKLQEREVTTRVMAALEMLQLAQFGRRYPSQLSGGQQQRVALGRSLVLEPYVLLLDEPLSNLDVVLRESTRSELKNLLKKVGITAVYVTHDQDEAFVLSDRILVMNHGRIVQAGTPAEIYERPASTFVCRFVGRSNVFDGRLVRKVGKHVSILLDGIGPFEADVEADIPVADGDECLLVVKPSEIEIVSDKASVQAAVFSGTVVQREYRGDFTDYRIDVAGREVLVRDSQKTLRNGEPVSLRINARNAALLPRD